MPDAPEPHPEDELPESLRDDELEEDPEPGQMPGDADVQAERPEGHID
jgi:hypothetical protein